MIESNFPLMDVSSYRERKSSLLDNNNNTLHYPPTKNKLTTLGRRILISNRFNRTFTPNQNANSKRFVTFLDSHRFASRLDATTMNPVSSFHGDRPRVALAQHRMKTRPNTARRFLVWMRRPKTRSSNRYIYIYIHACRRLVHPLFDVNFDFEGGRGGVTAIISLAGCT